MTRKRKRKTKAAADGSEGNKIPKTNIGAPSTSRLEEPTIVVSASHQLPVIPDTTIGGEKKVTARNVAQEDVQRQEQTPPPQPFLTQSLQEEVSVHEGTVANLKKRNERLLLHLSRAR